jgi:hypothetical protein
VILYTHFPPRIWQSDGIFILWNKDSSVVSKKAIFVNRIPLAFPHSIRLTKLIASSQVSGN